MKQINKLSTVMLLIGSLSMAACAIGREQSSAGQYIDDSVVTTQIKAKYVKSDAVDASAIKVETLKGTVQLSGFAKSENEKDQAAKIAKTVAGVKEVENDIVVKP